MNKWLEKKFYLFSLFFLWMLGVWTSVKVHFACFWTILLVSLDFLIIAVFSASYVYLPLLLGLPTLMFILGILEGEFGVVTGSVASGDIGDLGDIIIGDKLRFMTCMARLDGVSEPLGLSVPLIYH